MEIENNKKSPEALLKYLKKRYNTDEEYKKKKIEDGKERYKLNKEEILLRNSTDEDYKERRKEIARKYYLKIKAKRDEEKRLKKVVL